MSQKIYLNSIIGFVWLTLITLIITAQVSQMVLTALFTVLVLHFSEDLSKKVINKPKVQKIIALFLFILIVTVIGFVLFKSFNFMFKDLATMLETSQPMIISTLQTFGVENIQTIEEIYSIATNFVKENIAIITNSAILLLKVLIGVILGIMVHFTNIETSEQSNAWDYIIHKINSQFTIVYNSFRNVMSIQVLISLMNTAIITFMAFGITYLLYGEVLPYWYVIIPLTAILSLIPVVGNILINILLVLSTIQISIYYVPVGLLLFLIIHKLELAVIGNKMKEKVNINFMIIIVSMILGEMLFHSMSGMVLGMVIVVSLANMLRKIKLEPSK